MSDNEYAIECIVEHIMHMEQLDMMNDLGQDISLHEIEMFGRVNSAIKGNYLLDYK